MSASVNKVILVGNCGPNIRFNTTEGGTPVLTLSVATNAYLRRSDEEGPHTDQRTDWHRVVVWGQQAQRIHQFVRKGSQLYVEGSLSTRKWTDGNGAQRFTTEIRARSVQFLGRPAVVPQSPGEGSDATSSMRSADGQEEYNDTGKTVTTSAAVLSRDSD